jgi:allantoicase
MIPDGGIARFRVYGTVPPPPIGLGENEYSTDSERDPALNALDLAHVLNGGRVVFTSDQHFGVGPNVLLPGRGKDMGDGWETKRSRAPGHNDYLIIKLGEPGLLNYAEIDTNHFLGNFPESVELHATLVEDGKVPAEDAEWTNILTRSKTGPGKQHFFPLINVQNRPFSHVKVTMHPDGGIKRVRIVGRRSAPLEGYKKAIPSISPPEKLLPGVPTATLNGLTTAIGNFFNGSTSTATTTPKGFLGVRNVSPKSAPIALKVQELSSAGFSGYGDVIAHSSDKPFKMVNQGTAQKYEQLSTVESHYPASANAKSSIHVYHCQGVEGAKIDVKVLERHQFTKQAFIPLSKANTSTQKGYLVIVAKNGSDDLPDLSTLAVFSATSEQGIAYGAGIWHHPMIALGSEATDFAVVVYESATEPNLNCDEVFYDREVATIAL